MKELLVKKRTKRKVKALIKVLLLLTLDILARIWLASSFCSISLAGKLTQRFCQAQDLRDIAKR